MKNKDQRTQRVEVRYTPEQKAIHQKKADQAQLNLSEFLRQAGDNAEIIFNDISVKLRIIYEINKFGNNANQMAKAANTANLSGKLCDSLYREFIFRLKLVNDEIKTLQQIVKMRDKS